MLLAAKIGIFAIALLHLYILIIEVFLWDKPKGKKAFNLSDDFAQSTKVMAANQGIYNGFLSAGLFWALISVNFFSLAYFFLGCVLVAGIFGGITANKKIFFIQAIPALIVVLLLTLSQ